MKVGVGPNGAGWGGGGVGGWGGGGGGGWGWGWGVGRGPGAGAEVWLRWSAHPPGGAVSRGHVQFPAFTQTPQKWQLGFRSLCVLLHNLPQMGMHAVIFSPPVVSLYFVAQGNVCPGDKESRVLGATLSQDHSTDDLRASLQTQAHGGRMYLHQTHRSVLPWSLLKRPRNEPKEVKHQA